MLIARPHLPTIMPSRNGGEVANVAVLDDYQAVAASMADWSRLPAGSDVRSLRSTRRYAPRYASARTNS